MAGKKVIFKYPLEATNKIHNIQMPGQNPVIRAVGLQNDAYWLWAEVDPEAQELESTFKIVATGEAWTASSWNHVGTIFDGPFVWHVLQAVKL